METKTMPVGRQACQNCKSQFTIEPDDFTFYEKISVPPPTWCPECRLIRRLAWRNERTLHKRPCDLCKRSIISIVAPDEYVVYCPECWWSDKWDAGNYAMDYDPSRPFFDQMNDLLGRVPMMARHGLWTTVINSEYTNAVSYLKNCYLITHSDYNEDCAYGSMVTNSRDCFDNYLIDKCELCYDCVNCRKCTRTFFSVDCEDSYDLKYCRNCAGCSNCYGSVNLRNKQYYIFNEPCSKEEYDKKIKEINPQEARKLWNAYPQKYMHGTHNTNVSGDYVYHSKNTHDSYMVADMEDSRFCAFVTPGGMKDCYDFSHYGIHTELLYEALQCGEQTSRTRFSWWVCIGNQNVDYSMFAVGCENIFGCIGTKKKSYCILNKEYPESEYKTLRAKIIENMKQAGEYGEFFPIKFSPFCYNETIAQEFFPLAKSEALAKGYKWREREKRNYQIGGDVLGCKHEGECSHDCSTTFRLIEPEKQFYERFKLPTPSLCPNCRHYQRLKQRNPLKLWHRQCMNPVRSSPSGLSSTQTVTMNSTASNGMKEGCQNEFETSYSPERKEIVYCEECYKNEVM